MAGAGMVGWGQGEQLVTAASAVRRRARSAAEAWHLSTLLSIGEQRARCCPSAVSAVMMCWEATGSWWRGLVPSRLRDLRSVSWHAAFWNFQGSVGFLIGGAALYATSFRRAARVPLFWLLPRLHDWQTRAVGVISSGHRRAGRRSGFPSM